MTEDRHVLREVAWQDVFPGLMLFSVWRVAINLRALLLAAAGLLATSVGWWAVERVFSKAENPLLVRELAPGSIPDWSTVDAGDLPRLAANASPIVGAWNFFTASFRAVFDVHGTAGLAAFFLLASLVLLAIWSFFGGAITRLASVELTRGERLSWRQLLTYARSKWSSYFAAPMFPMFGVFLAVVPLAILGLLLRAGNVGVFLTALLWPIVLLAGVVMAILLVGLFLNWPLMWPTISTEGTDSFDALSRSYAYSFQRPLRYLLYVFVVAAIGGLAMLLAVFFAQSVLQLSHWAVAWGSGSDRLALALATGDENVSAGARLIGFWNGAVTLLVSAFAVSYFFCGMTAVYLLLRYHIDATETDEVYLPDEDEPYGLPPLATDEKGAVKVADGPGGTDTNVVSPEG